MDAPQCPYCGRPAQLVDGRAVYPHRADLADLKFWLCKPCDAYCGCHRAGARLRVRGRQVISDGTVPLGRLANAELRAAKQLAHAAFDPLWNTGNMTRRQAYEWLAQAMGIDFDDCHIGNFDTTQCVQAAQLCLERSDLPH